MRMASVPHPSVGSHQPPSHQCLHPPRRLCIYPPEQARNTLTEGPQSLAVCLDHPQASPPGGPRSVLSTSFRGGQRPAACNCLTRAGRFRHGDALLREGGDAGRSLRGWVAAEPGSALELWAEGLDTCLLEAPPLPVQSLGPGLSFCWHFTVSLLVSTCTVLSLLCTALASSVQTQRRRGQLLGKTRAWTLGSHVASWQPCGRAHLHSPSTPRGRTAHSCCPGHGPFLPFWLRLGARAMSAFLVFTSLVQGFCEIL